MSDPAFHVCPFSFFLFDSSHFCSLLSKSHRKQKPMRFSGGKRSSWSIVSDMENEIFREENTVVLMLVKKVSHTCGRYSTERKLWEQGGLVSWKKKLHYFLGVGNFYLKGWSANTIAMLVENARLQHVLFLLMNCVHGLLSLANLQGQFSVFPAFSAQSPVC